jgi:hypothetical protein
VAIDRAPGDLKLDPVQGDGHTLSEWLTTFQMAVVVLDPFTHESAWILETAGKMLQTYRGADCRVAWLVTGDEQQAQQFLGPWAKEILTFADPDRAAVKALGLERLPAFLHVRQDLTVVGASEGWDPAAWRDITVGLSKAMSWSKPTMPGDGAPAAYEGTPALA